ncbi:MAG: glycoside hydrolase family 25 protein [Clostridiales bacterium]|nr:glycoside hydrolase family 25 protein [Clostridiales bacterium]
MNLRKIAVSVLSCIIAVTIIGTTIPAGESMTCERRTGFGKDLASATIGDSEESYEFGPSAKEQTEEQDEAQNTAAWNKISAREYAFVPKGSSDKKAPAAAKTSLSKKAAADKAPGKTKADGDKEPSGGNTLGSSFDKEDVSGKSLETAYIRDKYMTAHNGIDISQFNGDIDWKKVVDSGIEAVIIRVGGRYGSSEGGIYKDKRREENLRNAIAAGLSVGVYFYSQAVTVEEGIEEAKFCLEAVDGYDIDLPIIIDYEWEPGYRLADGGSKEQRTDVVKAFCKTCTDAGYKSGIYASDYCFKDYLIPDQIYGKYYIWLAHWTSAELPGISYFGPFDGWQYSSVGSVPGISGNVDMDRFYWIDRFFVNYYVEDNLKYDSTEITLGVKTKTKTAEELGITSGDSRLFAGWNVFRERDNRWAAYLLTDETKKTVWVEPDETGNLPEGYGYKIYPDGVAISSTAKGGNVNFYAAWTNEGFVVRYHTGKTLSDTRTPVYLGRQTQTVSVKDLGFAKDGYKFAGWKVCRSCDNTWAAYEEGDESRKTVWVEKVNGELPEGYEYKYYPDKVKVSSTAPTGYVDFYAHWEKKASK